MTVSVRIARLDEAPLVRDIMLAAYAEYQDVLPVASGAHTETVDDVRSAMTQGGAALAHDGNQAVGSARYTPEFQDLYVGRLAVLPSHRRRGVASAMMRFLEEVAARVDCTAIRIGVRDSLPSKVALYQALGYGVVSIDPHPRGPDRVWTMTKRILSSR